MGKICELWKTLKERWQHRMPLFFKRICWIGMTMSGTAVAVQEALEHYNITPDNWWLVCSKYLIGVGVGMATVAKMTQSYDSHGKPVSDEKKESKTILNKDDF